MGQTPRKAQGKSEERFLASASEVATLSATFAHALTDRPAMRPDSPIAVATSLLQLFVCCYRNVLKKENRNEEFSV